MEMTSQEKDEIRRKWKNWLEEICKQVNSLLMVQHVWQEMGEIVKANSKIQVNSLLYDWLTANYVVQITTAIRKLGEAKKNWTGNYKDTISLWRLLDDIATHPEVISKEYFFERYNNNPELKQTTVPQEQFDKFAEEGASFISADKIRKDLKEIEEKTVGIMNYATQRIAHYDDPKKYRGKLPTFKEGDEAIALLEKQTFKYLQLIPNDFFVGLPTITYDWQEPLRHAWIEMSEEKKKWLEENKA